MVDKQELRQKQINDIAWKAYETFRGAGVIISAYHAACPRLFLAKQHLIQMKAFQQIPGNSEC
jgi:hypothetical protein